MTDKIIVEEVISRRDRRAFIALPYRLARGFPNWVLPFRLQVAELMNRKKHPFFLHSDAIFFVARQNGAVVGRIAAIEDREHNRTHGEHTLHFGLFDCENTPAVAHALFKRVEDEARARGMTLIRGPFNHSVHEEISLQISDFERQNFVMIPGNPPYYASLIEAQGYKKCVDLVCYGLELAKMNPRIMAMAPKLQARHAIRVRALTKASLDADAERLREVYNTAWQNNWPWRKATDEEFDHIVANMKQVADLNLVLIAEDAAGKVIGFSLALPNINEALAHNRSGRLFPFGLPRLLLSMRRGGIRTARVVAMGIMPEWRHKGVDVIFHHLQREYAMTRGLEYVELSQVLETNVMMVKTANLVGASVRMRHRLYEKPVS